MEHTEGGYAWALAVEHSALAQAIRESLWVYPIANVTHVMAIATLLGAIVVFDLRLLGALGGGRAAEAARLALPVARFGFLVAVPSGLVMFVAEASAYVANPVFLAKLTAIAVAVANLALFHVGSFRRIEGWPDYGTPASAKLAGAVSLAAWIGAVICGRFAAYY